MSNSTDRFDILRQLLTAASKGRALTESVQQALAQASAYVGLVAAAVSVWDENKKSELSVTFANSENSRRLLDDLEKDLFTQLRANRQLESAYLSFGGNPPSHSFTLPLKQAGKVFGAVFGLQEGERTLIAEDDFLESLTALIALYVSASGKSGDLPPSKEIVEKERLGAIIETAVTVNHEVNNPLTAILGNVQLLLLKRKDLDPELTTKLKTIETSALRIKDVTQRLMRVTSPRTVEYTEGARMIDLSPDEEEKSS
jgi:K+-sensing histidine kinase KdpD